MPNLEDDQEWEIKEVKDKTKQKGETYYLVKWEGWPTEYNLWIPERSMENAKEAIQRFERQQKSKGKAR